MGDTEDDVVNNRKKIFIGNLPFSIKPADLEAVFSKYGNIIGINVREDRQTGKPKGFAFVTFEEEAAAAQAMGNTSTRTSSGAGESHVEPEVHAHRLE